MTKLELQSTPPAWEVLEKTDHVSRRITELQHELDGYYAEMKELTGSEPDEVFMKLAGWSARASEIRSQLVRAEGRRAQAFRTREIEPFLDEIDRQFRLHSRVQSVREWDLKLQGKVF